MNSFISNISNKIRKSANVDYTSSTLFPILRADQIIPESEMMTYVKKIKKFVQLPDAYFDKYYQTLINNFVEHVQVLPVQYGEHLGGLLQDGLRHGYMALKLLIDTETKPSTPLYTYAVFSVALLADVYHIMGNQKAMISDAEGKFIAEWCPYHSSMIGKGDYYKLREFSRVPESLKHAANPIIATNILPELGLSWLSSDTSIFDMWIAVLTGHEDWAGKLGHLIKLMKLNIKDASLEAIIGLVPLRFLEAEFTEDAEAFLRWLREQLIEEKMTVNKKDSIAHVTEEGLVFDWNKVYERFAAVYSKSPGSVMLQTQLNHLGLSKLSGLDFTFEKVFGDMVAPAKSGKFGFLGGGNGNREKMVQKPIETKSFGERFIVEKGALGAMPSSKVAQTPPQAVLINAQLIYPVSVPIPEVSREVGPAVIQQNQQSQLPPQQVQPQKVVEVVSVQPVSKK